MKGVYLIGPPGVGKTTVMDRLLSGCVMLDPDVPISPLRVQRVVREGELVGIYLGIRRERFGGTDALAMNVMPAAKRFIAQRFALPIYGEGQRLGTPAFAAASVNPLLWVLLDAPDDVLDARCAERGSDQDPRWRAAAATRARNAADRIGGEVLRLDATLPPDVLAQQIEDNR